MWHVPYVLWFLYLKLNCVFSINIKLYLYLLFRSCLPVLQLGFPVFVASVPVLPRMWAFQVSALRVCDCESNKSNRTWVSQPNPKPNEQNTPPKSNIEPENIWKWWFGRWFSFLVVYSIFRGCNTKKAKHRIWNLQKWQKRVRHSTDSMSNKSILAQLPRLQRTDEYRWSEFFYEPSCVEWGVGGVSVNMFVKF